MVPAEKPQKKPTAQENPEEETEETEEETQEEEVKESMLLEKPIPNIPQEWKSDPYIMGVLSAKSDKDFAEAFAQLEQHHGAKMVKILIEFAKRTLKMYGRK